MHLLLANLNALFDSMYSYLKTQWNSPAAAGCISLVVWLANMKCQTPEDAQYAGLDDATSEGIDGLVFAPVGATVVVDK